jgi:hypothetical protein
MNQDTQSIDPGRIWPTVEQQLIDSKVIYGGDVSSVLCKRPFFPCAAGILGGGKVGILILDFHFSMAHSSSFVFGFQFQKY